MSEGTPPALQNYATRVLACASLAAVFLDQNISAVAAPLTKAALLLEAFDQEQASFTRPVLEARYRLERVLRDCRVEYHGRNRPGLITAVRALQVEAFAFEDRWLETVAPSVSTRLPAVDHRSRAA